MQECASQLSEADLVTTITLDRKKERKRRAAVKAAASPVDSAGVVEHVNDKKRNTYEKFALGANTFYSIGV